MHQLTEDGIEDFADSEAILERGKSYFKTGKVKSLSINGNMYEQK